MSSPIFDGSVKTALLDGPQCSKQLCCGHFCDGLLTDTREDERLESRRLQRGRAGIEALGFESEEFSRYRFESIRECESLGLSLLGRIDARCKEPSCFIAPLPSCLERDLRIAS